MITINLQWLAIPCIAVALYCLFFILAGAYVTFIAPKNELSSLAIVYVIVYYGPAFAISSLLAFLFWKAFK